MQWTRAKCWVYRWGWYKLQTNVRDYKSEDTHRHIVVLPGFVWWRHMCQVLDHFLRVLCLASTWLTPVNNNRQWRVRLKDPGWTTSSYLSLLSLFQGLDLVVWSLWIKAIILIVPFGPAPHASCVWVSRVWPTAIDHKVPVQCPS